MTDSPGPSRPPLPILPRSLHRPVAVTEGSLPEKPNKTAVRLWTAWRLLEVGYGSRRLLRCNGQACEGRFFMENFRWKHRCRTEGRESFQDLPGDVWEVSSARQ